MSDYNTHACSVHARGPRAQRSVARKQGGRERARREEEPRRFGVGVRAPSNPAGARTGGAEEDRGGSHGDGDCGTGPPLVRAIGASLPVESKP